MGVKGRLSNPQPSILGFPLVILPIFDGVAPQLLNNSIGGGIESHPPSLSPQSPRGFGVPL